MSTVGLRQNSWSESFAKFGYHFYAPARLAGHYFEKMTRPDDQCSVLFRVAYLGGSVIFSLLSIPAFFDTVTRLFRCPTCGGLKLPPNIPILMSLDPSQK